ncbi:MAG: S8 family peptidase [Bacillota bacterium]|nr:S8 family peptidase [Bacillota bacterium]
MAVEKRNIFLTNTADHLPYSPPSGFPKSNIPSRANFAAHGTFLKRKFEEAYNQNHELTQRQIAAIKYKDGIYLEFSGKANYDLVVKSLDNIREGVRLLNVRADEESNTVKATVYVPAGKETYFIKRVDQYLTEKTKNGEPRHMNLINSIEDISLAFLDAFWLGAKTDIPDDIPVWCEIWLRAEDDTCDEVESLLKEACEALNISLDEKAIYFPERIVRLIRADSKQLSELINTYAYIAELRRAPEVASFFDTLSPIEQGEWVENLIGRLELDFSNTSVCILDTGVNAGHPLLEMAFEDNSTHAIEPEWGESDHDGHGTEMAGIALYYDLQEKLISGTKHSLTHHLESVKILPPAGSNRPELYGSITQQAVFKAEIAHPEYHRMACMAITSDKWNTNDGSPTSWSGAVDALTYGVGDGRKRLFLISAGNVHPHDFISNEYPIPNQIHSVQNPGQSWNALTIGAYNQHVRISDERLEDFRPVADNEELSPYSSTSLSWDKKWPIKPEILCSGGNIASDGEYFTECVDLSLLTTHAKHLNRMFNTIFGTSSATAQAAWMAARITSEYPGIWPETVRALLVHSARWTEKMKKQFLVDSKKTSGRRALLRTCGYGVPNLEEAIQCRNNSVNLLVESEIQPFVKNKMNEMQIHRIPWPKDVLLGMGEIPVEMRVTLSYFIEPGPGEIGWRDKYRYPSCNLRFDVINQNENRSDFEKRINAKMREEKSDSGEGSSGSEHWYLGTENRDVGSIHSDFRVQSAVELCEANYIAVYPVIGWWRTRTHLKCYNKKIRYSLIVTLSTPEAKIDFYTPIITQIKTAQQIPVPIEVNTARRR